MRAADPRPEQRWHLFRKVWLACLAIIFAATFLAHARSLDYPFSDFDDPIFVTDVTGYRGLSPEHLRWDFTRVAAGHYQPLTYLSYGLDYVLWGKGRGSEGAAALNPAAFHFTNILLHALNAVLVALVTRRLVARAAVMDQPLFLLTASSAAALFWGLHPLRVESVAWVTERRDVLSALFLLATVLAYLRYTAATGGARAGWYGFALVLLVLSLLSKAWGMTLFVVLIIIDAYPLRRLPILPWDLRRDHVRILLEKLPFAVLGMVAAAAAAYAQKQAAGTVLRLEDWSIPQRLAQAVFGLFFYLYKTVWPTNLAPLYELRTDTQPTDPRFIIAALCLAGLIAVMAAQRRRAPALIACAACYLVLVSPVLGLFQSGIQLVADRYSYLSCIPWSMLAGWAVAKLGTATAAPRGKGLQPVEQLRRGVLLTAGVALVILAAGTWVQTSIWRSNVDTFRRPIEAGWDGPLARSLLGRALEKQGKVDEAMTHYRAGLASGDPNGEAAYHLANLLRAEGDLLGAERNYRDALTRRRDKLPVHLGLGLTYLRQDRLGEAEKAFRDAVAEFEKPGREPDPKMDGVAYLNLAGAMDMNGNLLGSREYLVKATQYPLTRAEAERILRITDEELRAAGQR